MSEHKSEREYARTVPVCRRDELYTVSSLYDESVDPVRYRYYCEFPNSKGDMVRDIFFDMTVAELQIEEKFTVFNFKAEYSYFYGDEDDPEAYGSNIYKSYEWEGTTACTRLASDEFKSAIEEYNRQCSGKDSIFVDERRSRSQLRDELSSLWDTIRKTRDYEQLGDLIFDTLDSLGLRSYENEKPAKRHCYNREAIDNRWRRRENLREAVTLGGALAIAVPYLAKETAKAVGVGAAMLVEEEIHARSL